jgi:hypothetical protein
MKNIMTQAVDTGYKLFWLKQNDPEKYEATLDFGNRYTRFWDAPKMGMCWYFQLRPQCSQPSLASYSWQFEQGRTPWARSLSSGKIYLRIS